MRIVEFELVVDEYEFILVELSRLLLAVDVGGESKCTGELSEDDSDEFVAATRSVFDSLVFVEIDGDPAASFACLLLLLLLW